MEECRSSGRLLRHPRAKASFGATRTAAPQTATATDVPSTVGRASTATAAADGTPAAMDDASAMDDATTMVDATATATGARAAATTLRPTATTTDARAAATTLHPAASRADMANPTAPAPAIVLDASTSVPTG